MNTSSFQMSNKNTLRVNENLGYNHYNDHIDDVKKNMKEVIVMTTTLPMFMTIKIMMMIL